MTSEAKPPPNSSSSEPTRPSTARRTRAAIAWLSSSRLGRAARWLSAGDPLVGVFMLALVCYYIATPGVFQGKASGDGWFGFEYLNAIVYRHTLDMQAVMPSYKPYFGIDSLTHHMPNRCPFGPVLLWMPLYLLGCALVELARLAHLAPRVSPDAPFLAWVTGLSALGAVLVGWRYVYVLLERHVSRDAARLGSTAAVWATPLVWYAVTQPLYQHAPAFMLVAIGVERWDATRGEASFRRMALLGLLGGLAMEMRAQEVLWLLLPSAEVAWHLVRGPSRRAWFVAGVVLVAAAALAFAPQVWVWHYYTGGLRGPQIEPLRLLEPMPIVSLFSTRSGLFPWSPVCYAAALGLALGGRARGLALALASVFAVELYVVSSAWVPSGAYSFGARRLSDAAPLYALGIALLYDRVQRSRPLKRALVGFVGLCVALALFAMEMQRQKKSPSSGAYARTAARYLHDAGAPAWCQRLFDRIGYPFVQPVGWLFALAHHAPISAFEGVVGNFYLDRDGQWFTVLNGSLAFDQDVRAMVLVGAELPPAGTKRPAVTTGPVRLLVPMFAKERFRVELVGALSPGVRRVRWNGGELPATTTPLGLSFEVPVERARAGVNELELDVPVGSTLSRLDFTAYDRWWVK